MKILIVEDQVELQSNMAQYLRTESYQVDTAGDFEAARDLLDAYEYDCVLLDVNLPGGSGLSLLENLKNDNKTDGVIIISAKNSIHDRIEGLNLGADDYLVKPFHLAELNARIAALIRRRRFDGQKVMVLHDITLDLYAKTVHVGTNKVDLTRKEYDLLLFFASNKNRVLSKNAIAEHLSGTDTDFFDNLDFVYTHIKNLKRKLVVAGAGDYIRSVYGMGYKFEL